MSMRMLRRAGVRAGCTLLGTAALFALGVPSAHAAIVTFTDRATFTAAASTLGTVNIEGFESLPTGPMVVGPNALGQVTMTIALQGTTTTTGASVQSSSPITGTRELNMNADSSFRKYTLTFAGGDVSAFGLDYTGANTGGDAALFADGQLFVFGNNTASGNGFFGIISTTPLSEIGIEDAVPGLPTEIFDSDNYTFVNAIPEPATFALLAPAVLLVLRRRATISRSRQCLCT
jgi:hypothetical protein